jgi:hypothetical protein
MKDECNDTFHKVRYVTREEALDMAIKALEQEPKWISVSERLPEVMDGSGGECSDDVLVCVADYEYTIISTGFYGYYPNSPSQQGWWSAWAHGCHQLDRKYKVIAWMPLPSPYKAESEEE